MDGTHPIEFDLGALALIAGSFAGLLPALASGIAALWYALLIYDRLRRK